MRIRSEHKYLLLIIAGFILQPYLCGRVDASQIVDTASLNVGVVGEEEFMQGYVLIPRIPIFWESSEPFSLSVSSIDPVLGVSDDASYSKPLEDLQWKLSDEPDWFPLRQELEEMFRSTDTGSGVIYIDVIIELDWLTDAPGEYRTDLVFTIGSI